MKRWLWRYNDGMYSVTLHDSELGFDGCRFGHCDGRPVEVVIREASELALTDAEREALNRAEHKGYSVDELIEDGCLCAEGTDCRDAVRGMYADLETLAACIRRLTGGAE